MNETKDMLAKAKEWQDLKLVKSLGLYAYFRPITDSTANRVVTDGRECVMLGSNNYLGLTHHPKVIEASVKATQALGTGCSGSRFLNGNLAIHEELEGELADFLGREAAVVFSTGFLANQGAISAISGKRDLIYSDQENHASIIEGTRVAAAKTHKYKHNSATDLASVLAETRESGEGAMVVSDSVFSMSGSIVDLPSIARVAKANGCRVYLDEAHSLGVLGKTGRGADEHFGATGAADFRSDLVMGTFSKSLASVGGFVAGDADTIAYIRHRARTQIFTAGLPPACAAAALAALRILKAEPELVDKLWRNTIRMNRELKKLGFLTLGSQTPIIPLLVGEDLGAFSFAQRLYEEGVFATPVIQPAVPPGCALMRTSFMSAHTDEDLDFALAALEKIGTELGIIENGKPGMAIGESAVEFSRQCEAEASHGMAPGLTVSGVESPEKIVEHA